MLLKLDNGYSVYSETDMLTLIMMVVLSIILQNSTKNVTPEFGQIKYMSNGADLANFGCPVFKIFKLNNTPPNGLAYQCSRLRYQNCASTSSET